MAVPLEYMRACIERHLVIRHRQGIHARGRDRGFDVEQGYLR